MRKASNRRCGHTSSAKAVHGATLKLHQLRKRIFSMAYSNTMATVAPSGAVGPRLAPPALGSRFLFCMQWGADACPVSLKLALSGILCFSASVPRSLHTKCDSTHFPTDVNILYKNTTFWRPLALALPLSIKSQGKWCPDRSNASWEVLLFSCLLCWSVSEWYLKFSPLDF